MYHLSDGVNLGSWVGLHKRKSDRAASGRLKLKIRMNRTNGTGRFTPAVRVNSYDPCYCHSLAGFISLFTNPEKNERNHGESDDGIGNI